MNKVNELKPCPFCGNHARLDFSRDGGKQYFDEYGYVQYTDFIYLVSCEFCLAKTGNYERTADAIAAWNRRANEVN